MKKQISVANLRNPKNFSKRYNWIAVQNYYDAGHTTREVCKKFGMSGQAIVKAKLRGDFTPRSLADSIKLSYKRTTRKQSIMSDKARKNLSIRQSINNSGGKSKWYMVAGQSVQGTWERNLALKFEEFKIIWKKLSTGKDVWPYVIEGKLKNYTPDFYLPKYNLYLDPKGYWWGNDKNKIELVRLQHTDKKLCIIEKKLYQQLITTNNVEEFELLLLSQLS